jgi:hypothetical protein
MWVRIGVEGILSEIAMRVRIEAPVTIATWVRIGAPAVIVLETSKFRAVTVPEAEGPSAALAAVAAKLDPVARAALPVLVVLAAAVAAAGEQSCNSAEIVVRRNK